MPHQENEIVTGVTRLGHLVTSSCQVWHLDPADLPRPVCAILALGVLVLHLALVSCLGLVSHLGLLSYLGLVFHLALVVTLGLFPSTGKLNAVLLMFTRSCPN
jgi:hypothetical protein